MKLHEAGFRPHSYIVLVSQVKERLDKLPQDLFVCMLVVVPILSFASPLLVDVLRPDSMPNPLSICSILVGNIDPTLDVHDTAIVVSGSLPKFEAKGHTLQVMMGTGYVGSLFVFARFWVSARRDLISLPFKFVASVSFLVF